MTTSLRSESGAQPPRFEQAKNTRQKARACGLDPNYWYAVEHSNRVKPGQVVEVVFWKRSIALFRGQDGVLRAVENRCAHRQLKLSIGTVEQCNLVCPYHGWVYDGDGRVVDIPHELFGRKFPKFKIPSVPVKERYGLIFIFPGDPERAASRALPRIENLEGPDSWTCIPVDFTWKAHHSMIIDNVSDFTHAYLHRRFRPFTDAKLTRYETVGDRVHVSYDTKVGRGKLSGLFVDHDNIDTNQMDLCYEYPYQWSNTDDQIKHWLFVLPIDEQTTRAFFLFHFRALKVPFLPVRIPKAVMIPFMRIANEMLVKPLLREDGVAVEAEQEGYNLYFDAPLAELNPAVKAFQDLTIRKWEAYLEERDRVALGASGASRSAGSSQPSAREPLDPQPKVTA